MLQYSAKPQWLYQKEEIKDMRQDFRVERRFKRQDLIVREKLYILFIEY